MATSFQLLGSPAPATASVSRLVRCCRINMAEDSGSNTAESQVPLLHRSETSDLRLTYTAEQGPPIASTVTSTVETEDLPTPVDLNEVEPEKSGKERLENSGDEEEEEAIILKPPTKKKSLGPNAAFYSGTLCIFQLLCSYNTRACCH